MEHAHLDHIVPRADGGDEWLEDNLQILCAPCHAEKTRTENRARSIASLHNPWNT